MSFQDREDEEDRHFWRGFKWGFWVCVAFNVVFYLLGGWR